MEKFRLFDKKRSAIDLVMESVINNPNSNKNVPFNNAPRA